MKDRSNREVEVFTRAVQMSPNQRAEYLASACADDPEMRCRIEALLHAHEDVGDFLEKAPHAAKLEGKRSVQKGKKPGDRNGP